MTEYCYDDGSYYLMLNYNKKLDNTYFDNIDCEAKAYLLGFIMTDGYVYRGNKRSTLKVMINDRDEYICNLIKDKVHTKNKILKSKRNIHEIAISFESKNICNSLEKYSMVQHKTGKTKFPKMIPHCLYRHFIRGVFDGNGWITIFKRHHKKRFSQSVGFCGDYDLMLNIRNILIEELDVFPIKVCDRGTYCTIVWSAKKDVINIYHYLYDKSNFYLSRKYKKFHDFVN